jgi:AcrR family transcriptional regulator
MSKGNALKAKDDTRVKRTSERLRRALFALIRERGFEALTVRELSERAHVGRTTFYAHFENKEDLLLSGMDSLAGELRERQRRALASAGPLEQRMFSFTRELLAHVDEHRHLFGAMTGTRSGAAVQRALLKLIADLVRADVRAVCRSDDRVRVEAVTQAVSGAMMGLLLWWLTSERMLRYEEVDALFRRLATPLATPR